MKKMLLFLAMLCAICLNGCGDQTEQIEPTVYPTQIKEFAGVSAFEPSIPSTIFVTPASENGLGGTLYKFEGEVTRIVSKSDSPSGYGFFVLKTEHGEMVIHDPVDIILKNNDFGEMINGVDLRSYFELPEVGEYVCAYAEYQGYSDAYHAAVSTLGGTEYMTKICVHVAEENQLTSTEDGQDDEPLKGDNELFALIDDLEECVGDDEYITSITLNDRILNIAVDLSHVDLGFLSIDDLAYSRTSSITDKILEHDKLDSKWEKIVLDFGTAGHIELGKDAIQTNEYGMRYMNSAKFRLQ